MILCNGRAIFHEKRAERSLKGIRAGGQEAPGNRGFRTAGTETQEQRATEVQEDRIETGEAPGNRSFEGLGRVSGVPGNRDSRRTGSEDQAAAGNRSCRRLDEFKAATGNRSRQEIGNEFQELRATGVLREHRATGASRGNRATGTSREIQATGNLSGGGKFAQGNGDGTRAGSGSASSQALSDGGIGKLGSGSRSRIFAKFGQKRAESRKGLRPLRFLGREVSGRRRELARGGISGAGVEMS